MHQPSTSGAPTCTICGKTADLRLMSLNFAHKMHLPSEIELHACAPCDFAFVTPADQAAYAAYYASQRTDLIHEEAEEGEPSGWVLTQAPLFAKLLETSTPITILDYGCGGGDLIKLLATRYPQHQFIGFDMHENRRAPKQPNVRFISNTAGLEGKCDLVILSHVLEHFADFKELEKVTALVSDTGALYIEVPNPSTYRESMQREYLFFIDRMHLSHFSPKSMQILGAQQGLTIQGYGTLKLPYRDGTTYPSHYFFYQQTTHPTQPSTLPTSSTIADIETYIAAEKSRASSLATLPPETPILIYGFGDNFFRCRSAGGPLAGRPILAIIDQRHVELAASEYGKDYTFMSMEDALSTYPNAPITITITWGTNMVAETLKSKQQNPVPILAV